MISRGKQDDSEVLPTSKVELVPRCFNSNFQHKLKVIKNAFVERQDRTDKTENTSDSACTVVHYSNPQGEHFKKLYDSKGKLVRIDSENDENGDDKKNSTKIFTPDATTGCPVKKATDIDKEILLQCNK